MQSQANACMFRRAKWIVSIDLLLPGVLKVCGLSTEIIGIVKLMCKHKAKPPTRLYLSHSVDIDNR